MVLAAPARIVVCAKCSCDFRGLLDDTSRPDDHSSGSGNVSGTPVATARTIVLLRPPNETAAAQPDEEET
ncbi:hypothetical protein AB3X96_21870 [Paraburkholderia sp. BR13439]